MQDDLVLPMVLPTWLLTEVLTSCLRIWTFQPFDSKFFPARKLLVRRLTLFLLERSVNDLSKDQWQTLIAEIPEDVKKEIGMSKSAGTQLDRLDSSSCFALKACPQYNKTST